MKANEFFTQEWGTGFTKATLFEKNGLLEMSMEDIYSTMERYAELRLSNVVGRSEQLLAVEKLKDFAYEVCPLHREDDLEEIVGSL